MKSQLLPWTISTQGQHVSIYDVIEEDNTLFNIEAFKIGGTSPARTVWANGRAG